MACNQSTIDNFLDFVANVTNVTQVLAKCENSGPDNTGICGMAWGNGNPDISGIGAVIAYAIQVGLTCIICPLYAAIFAYFGKEESPRHYSHHEERPGFYSSGTSLDDNGEEDIPVRKRSRRRLTLKRLSKHLDGFTNLSCQFVIAISVAAIVRIAQGATLFEKVFLQALLMMQALAVLAVCVASVPGPERNLVIIIFERLRGKRKGKVKEETTEHTENTAFLAAGLASSTHVERPEKHDFPLGPPSRFWKRMLGVLFYPLVTLALFWVFISKFDVTPARLDAIKEVMVYCANTKAYSLDPRWAGYTESDAWPAWILTLIHINEIDYIIVGFIFIATYGICALALWIFTPAGVALGLSAPMIYFMVQMIKQRTYLAKVTGPQYQDSAWGFGQVLALLMWIPFVAWLIILWTWLILTNIYSNYFRELNSKKRGENENDGHIPKDGDVSKQLKDAEEGRSHSDTGHLRPGSHAMEPQISQATTMSGANSSGRNTSLSLHIPAVSSSSKPLTTQPQRPEAVSHQISPISPGPAFNYGTEDIRLATLPSATGVTHDDTERHH